MGWVVVVVMPVSFNAMLFAVRAQYLRCAAVVLARFIVPESQDNSKVMAAVGDGEFDWSDFHLPHSPFNG